MKRFLALSALSTVLLLPASAQCVMCYTTAHAQQSARARVLDAGIVLLGAPPCAILAGFIAFVFWRNNPTPGEALEPESRKHRDHPDCE